MVEAVLADIVESPLSGLRFREIETSDCAALIPRNEIQTARSLQLAAARTGASSARTKQHPADPQHSLIEQARQFGEVARREAPRADSGPGQLHFELRVKCGDRRYPS